MTTKTAVSLKSSGLQSDRHEDSRKSRNISNCMTYCSMAISSEEGDSLATKYTCIKNARTTYTPASQPLEGSDVLVRLVKCSFSKNNADISDSQDDSEMLTPSDANDPNSHLMVQPTPTAVLLLGPPEWRYPNGQEVTGSLQAIVPEGNSLVRRPVKKWPTRRDMHTWDRYKYDVPYVHRYGKSYNLKVMHRYKVQYKRYSPGIFLLPKCLTLGCEDRLRKAHEVKNSDMRNKLDNDCYPFPREVVNRRDANQADIRKLRLDAHTERIIANAEKPRKVFGKTDATKPFRKSNNNQHHKEKENDLYPNRQSSKILDSGHAVETNVRPSFLSDAGKAKEQNQSQNNTDLKTGVDSGKLPRMHSDINNKGHAAVNKKLNHVNDAPQINSTPNSTTRELDEDESKS